MPRTAYMYHPEVGTFYYGEGHPMKPQRIRMAHSLVLNYGLCSKMEVFNARSALEAEMTDFHAQEYVAFLKRASPDSYRTHLEQLTSFGMGQGTDCPAFDGLFQFCQLYTAGSIDGARKLNNGQCDVAVNWSGGLHHAKKSEASGFCYINDIVLAILELLKVHARVLYIDIDIHHGDGVEEAFYTTDRVMTVSFHKYGDFFPGTGDVVDTGVDRGKNYSLNFPLGRGITDEGYESIFKPVIQRVMDMYRPGAVVLQCGADSLTGDRLGCFNVTLKGHGECVRFVKSFGLPTLVLGGGGYNIRNVSRCWAYETSVLLEQDIGNNIPYNEYFQYYAPDYELHLTPSAALKDENEPATLEQHKNMLLEYLSTIAHAPSVQMQHVPGDLFIEHIQEEDPDERERETQTSTFIMHDAEFYRDGRDQDPVGLP